MSSDSAIRDSGSTCGKAPRRLTARATLTELMDEPCSYEDLRDCLRDLAAVNRLTRACGATLNWLSQFIAEARPLRPLHVVDVGCGGGDTLRHIEQWAAEKKIAMLLTGVDCNTNVIRAAREFTPAESSIEWVEGTAESLLTGSTAQTIDIVISSLFTHHLSDEGVISFLQWMESTAVMGWMISDLYRTHTARWGFTALANIARWHRFVRHDGPVSFRRAFLPEEWRRLCAHAGIETGVQMVDVRWPARIYVSRVKQQ